MASTIAGTFEIDTGRSTVTFSGRSSVHPIDIRSKKPHGRFTIAEEDGGLVADGTLVVPVKSLRTGQPVQDIELRRQIQARRHPTIEASIEWLRRGDGDHLAAGGSITFFGTTRPAHGSVTIIDASGGIRVVGASLFDVREFGFSPPKLLGMKVDPEITVEIDLLAARR